MTIVGDRGTILLVEDNDDFREVVAFRLRKAGFHVLEASNAGMAWQLMQAHTVDAVIVDILLPGIDGRTLARQLRRDPGQRIVLIGFSALPDDDTATLHPFDAIFVKPDVEPVLATLHRLLGARESPIATPTPLTEDPARRCGPPP